MSPAPLSQWMEGKQPTYNGQMGWLISQMVKGGYYVIFYRS
jgi:hypothetical protein